MACQVEVVSAIYIRFFPILPRRHNGSRSPTVISPTDYRTGQCLYWNLTYLRYRNGPDRQWAKLTFSYIDFFCGYSPF